MSWPGVVGSTHLDWLEREREREWGALGGVLKMSNDYELYEWYATILTPFKMSV